MPKLTTHYLIFITLALFSSAINGQQLSSYNMQHLPQRSYMNPSFSPHGKMYVGIPLFSGISHSYINNGFVYNDLFRRNDDNALILDIGNAIDKMGTRNYLTIHNEIELLSFGARVGKNYLSFNITEKLDFNFNFSKSLMKFLHEGNASTMGAIQQLNPGVEGIHYREYGIAWTREISKVFIAGVRVKYLYGMEHVITEGNGITMYTNPVDYTITASTDYTIYTSGLDSGSFKDFRFGNYVTGKRNHGYGIDAGITIRPLPTVEFTASVIDFGKMNWSSGNAIHHTNTEQEGFVYSGINLDEFIYNDSLNGESYLEAIGDSLYDTFNVTTTSESYTYKMPVQLFFSASYVITPRYKISALVRNKNAHHQNFTDYQFSFTGKSKTWLNYTVSLNKFYKAKVTPGAGFTLNFRNNQIYFVSDNVPGLFSWKKTHNCGFRAGINLMFGTWLKYAKAPQPTLDTPPTLQ